MGKAFSNEDGDAVFIPGKDGQGRKILRKNADGEWKEFTTKDYVEAEDEGEEPSEESED